MQSLEFARTLKEINRALMIPQLSDLITPWITHGSNANISQEQKNQFAALLFESNAGYRRLMDNLSSRRILDSLEMGRFYEPSRLAGMISAVTSVAQAQQIYTNWQYFAQFYSFSELLQSLARLARSAEQLLEKEKIGTVNPSDGILELELLEYADEVGISPKRLQLFAAGVTSLHEHIARVLGVDNDNLTFKYFDSGSSVRVGIECAKAIVEIMTVLFTQWWDRIVYFRYESFDKKIAALSKTMAFADTVQQAAEKGTITQEVGENLKLRVFREVENLTRVGVIIPQSQNATIDHRQLLTEVRNTKLLSESTATEPVELPPTQPPPQ